MERSLVMNWEFFSNNRYKVLQCMAQRRIDVNGKEIVPLSQQDIADVVQLSKKQVNTIISELKENGYILQKSLTRGKYFLTPKALNIVAQIQKEGNIEDG